MHACMHACIHTHIHTYVRTHIYIYIYIHACIYRGVSVFKQNAVDVINDSLEAHMTMFSTHDLLEIKVKSKVTLRNKVNC